MNQTSRGPIWFGIGLVVVVLGVVAWIYFLQPSQALNLNIQLTANPTTVLVGDPFDVSVSLANNANSAMQNASIAIVLPQGIVSVGAPAQSVVTQTIGDLNAGGVSHQDFQLVAVAGTNSVVHLTAKVMYGTTGSSAQFENDGSLSLPIGGPAVSVNLSAPSQVFSGQNFPVTVSYNNNAAVAISGLSLAMQYPPAYTFSNASSALATNGNSSWNLGTLAPNAAGTIAINGNLVGPTDASYPIAAMLSENIGGQSYPIAVPSANVALAASPLMFTVEVNNSQSYVSHAGDSLNYSLMFTNNAPVTFQNVVITAKLAGSMFNFPSLASDGSFNSVNDTLTWNGAASPQLLSLAPGQSGSVDFTVSTKSAFPIRLLSDKNYSLNVGAQLQSPTVPPGTDASSTISVANVTTKLSGAISLASPAYHREPTGAAGVGGQLGASGITNSGPYPPVVNKATQYTIHWLITNYATDADNVTISAYLQSGTTCTGKMVLPSTAATASASSTLTCNPSSGQVTWTIPVVPATTGIADKPLEAVFQVMNTPAVNQVGQDITLLGAATLTATDGFTSSTLTASAPEITTALPDDTSVASNNRSVTQ
jgi:hypothetical protein